MTRRKRPTLAEHDALVRDMRESLSYAQQLRRELHAARLERDAACEERDIARKQADTAAAHLRVRTGECERLWESLQTAVDDRRMFRRAFAAAEQRHDDVAERIERLEELLREARVLLREREPALRWDVAVRGEMRGDR